MEDEFIKNINEKTADEWFNIALERGEDGVCKFSNSGGIREDSIPSISNL